MMMREPISFPSMVSFLSFSSLSPIVKQEKNFQFLFCFLFFFCSGGSSNDMNRKNKLNQIKKLVNGSNVKSNTMDEQKQFGSSKGLFSAG